MRHKFKLWQVVLAGINVLSLTAALILTAAGGSAAKHREYDQAALRWSGGEGGYTQMSVFFTEDSGVDKNAIEAIKAGLRSELRSASIEQEPGKTLIPDACSAEVGTFTARGSGNTRSEALMTAVSGSFFMFRSFDLLSGAYFTDSDIMHDGAVIDSELAWDLFGSDDVAGMTLRINDVPFYISAVIAAPSDKTEKKCAGKTRRIYVSYEGASAVSGSAPADSSSGTRSSADNKDSKVPEAMPAESISADFSKVSTYECIVPDPVKDFAKNALKKQLKTSCKGKYEMVVNTRRYDPTVRAKAFSDLSALTVKKVPVAFPYWENASRITEMRLTFIYFARRLALVIPVLTLLWLIAKGYILLKKNKQRIKSSAAGYFTQLWGKLSKKEDKPTARKEKI